MGLYPASTYLGASSKHPWSLFNITITLHYTSSPAFLTETKYFFSDISVVAGRSPPAAVLISIPDVVSHHLFIHIPRPIYYIIVVLCSPCARFREITTQAPLSPRRPQLVGKYRHVSWCMSSISPHSSQPSSVLTSPCSGVPGKFKGCNTCRTRRVKVGFPFPTSVSSTVC